MTQWTQAISHDGLPDRLLADPVRIHRGWLVILAWLLVGYAAFNKGFAYVGVAPFFVGEIVLVAGLLALAFAGGIRVLFHSPPALLWMVLAVHGMIRTLPYLKTYQMDALRDAALFGYGVYAMLVCVSVYHTLGLRRMTDWFGRAIPFFLLWTPFAFLFQRLASEAVPKLPGSDVKLIYLKAGDTEVHLAGIAAFITLGLFEWGASMRNARNRWLMQWVWWTLWVLCLLLAGATNRGGLLAIVIASSVVAVLYPRCLLGWSKVIVIMALLVVVSLTFNLKIELDRREVSAQQLLANVTSIFTGRREADLEDTKRWRLEWWQGIINYTINGRYYWWGKGYGINLALDDGFAGTENAPILRSPHNAHLNALARGGVPGFVLWVSVQLCFGVTMLLAHLRARRLGFDWWARVDVWILAYWAAFLVNATFDVYLEGPQGGIPFWCLIGLGLAAREIQRNRQPDRLFLHRP